MEKRFKLLGFFSILFKIFAVGVLVLLSVMLVRVVIGPRPDGVIISNAVISLSVTSLIFYALGEVIRILRVIEEQTRKPS